MPLAQVRLSPSLKSGFANLPQAWVNALWDTRKDLKDVVLELSWTPAPTDSGDAKRNTAYVGWGGKSSAGAASLPPLLKSEAAASASTVAHQIIELDSFYGRGLGLQDGQKVSVEFVKNAVRGTTVNVEPASEDDWEILELQAEYLEEQLLSQVRVVSVGQIMSIWVRGQTPISLRVIDTVPAARCVKLDNDSEIIVAPKTRRSSSAPKEVFGSNTDHDVPVVVKDESVTLELRSFPAEYVESSQADSADDGVEAENIIQCHPSTLSQLDSSWMADKVVYLSQALQPGRDAIDDLDDEERQKNNVEGSTGQRRREDDGAKPPKLFGVYSRIQPLENVPADHIAVGGSLRKGLSLGKFDRVRISLPPRGPVQVSKIVLRKLKKDTAKTIVLSGKASKLAEEQAKMVVRLAREKLVSDPRGIVVTDGSVMQLTDTSLTENPTEVVMLLEGKFQPIKSTDGHRDAALYTVLGAEAAAKLPLEVGADMHAQPSDNSWEIDAAPPNLGGVDVVRHQLRNYIAVRLGCRLLRKQLRAPGLGGVLLYGAHGSGKTTLLETVFYEMNRSKDVLANCQLVECGTFADETIANLKQTFTEIFDEASFRAPSIVAFDNLDRLLMAEQEHMDSSRYRQISELFCDLARQAMQKYELIVVATAQNQTSLNATLSENHIFDESIHLLPPAKKQRREILEAIISNGTKVLSSSLPHLDLVEICSSTEGYLASDLKTLVERALQAATMRQLVELSGSSAAEVEGGQLTLTQEDFKSAQDGYVPSSLRGVKLQSSDVSWSDIGGLTATRQTLKETFEWPTKYAPIFSNCPLRLRSGLLLYGFPGCGKTMLASAVAKECGLNFISVKGPEILNKYIGASEAGVRDLFERAQAAKPCILFFDEFDAIAPRRGNDNTGVTDRVVNQLLTQMDGAEKVEGVYVLAATSRPDMIDPALLRPGRLDKSLLCGMPDVDERSDILRAVAVKLDLAPEVDLLEWAKTTEDYSGADLQALLYNAHLNAIHEGIDVERLTAADKENKSPEADGDDQRLEFSVAVASRNSKSQMPRMTAAERGYLENRLQSISKNLQQSTDTKGTMASIREKIFIHDHHIQAAFRTTRPSVPAQERERLTRVYDEFLGGRAAGGPPTVGQRATLA